MLGKPLFRRLLLRDVLIVRFLSICFELLFSLDHDRVRAHKLFNGHPDRFPDPMLKNLGLRYENIGYSNDQALVITPPQ